MRVDMHLVSNLPVIADTRIHRHPRTHGAESERGGAGGCVASNVPTVDQDEK